MSSYRYLKHLNVDVVARGKKEFVEAPEVNQKVQLLVIKNTELLHALRVIRAITRDYNIKTSLKDVLKSIEEVATRNLKLFGEESDQ